MTWRQNYRTDRLESLTLTTECIGRPIWLNESARQSLFQEATDLNLASFYSL